MSMKTSFFENETVIYLSKSVHPYTEISCLEIIIQLKMRRIDTLVFQ